MLKRFSVLFYMLFSIILISGCGSLGSGSSSSADWAYSFVVWNDDIYEATDEEIEPNMIGNEIGEIKQYSDFEGVYGNGFSNKYSAGTKLFAIEKIETSENIAIHAEGEIFIKAINKGKYGGRD